MVTERLDQSVDGHAAPVSQEVESVRPRYPGIPAVINGNGAVAYVMSHVCGGVIGYPITPSTEISEMFEAGPRRGRRQRLGQAPVLLQPRG